MRNSPVRLMINFLPIDDVRKLVNQDIWEIYLLTNLRFKVMKMKRVLKVVLFRINLK